MLVVIKYYLQKKKRKCRAGNFIQPLTRSTIFSTFRPIRRVSEEDVILDTFHYNIDLNISKRFIKSNIIIIRVKYLYYC